MGELNKGSAQPPATSSRTVCATQAYLIFRWAGVKRLDAEALGKRPHVGLRVKGF